MVIIYLHISYHKYAASKNSSKNLPSALVCSHLSGMIKKAFAANREEKVDRKRNHVYYHLTDAGREYVDSIVTEALSLSCYMAIILEDETMDNRKKIVDYALAKSRLPHGG